MDYFAIVTRIDNWMDESNVKKTQFYAEVGITSQAISLWRTGGAKPSIESLEKIAARMGITLKELMFGQEEKPAPKNESELDGWFYDFVKSLTPSEQFQIVGYIQSLRGAHKG